MANDDFNEGDMAVEIAERLLLMTTLQEIGALAYEALEAEVKSWPPEKIRAHYNSMTGVTNDE